MAAPINNQIVLPLPEAAPAPVTGRATTVPAAGVALGGVFVVLAVAVAVVVAVAVAVVVAVAVAVVVDVAVGVTGTVGAVVGVFVGGWVGGCVGGTVGGTVGGWVGGCVGATVGVWHSHGGGVKVIVGNGMPPGKAAALAAGTARNASITIRTNELAACANRFITHLHRHRLAPDPELAGHAPFPASHPAAAGSTHRSSKHALRSSLGAGCQRGNCRMADASGACAALQRKRSTRGQVATGAPGSGVRAG